MSIQQEAGRALRRSRVAHGFTLRQVAERSDGAFKPTAVAGYERAERSISLQRFCELCGSYGVAPEIMLAEILVAAGERPQIMVDLTQSEERAAASSPSDG